MPELNFLLNDLSVGVSACDLLHSELVIMLRITLVVFGLVGQLLVVLLLLPLHEELEKDFLQFVDLVLPLHPPRLLRLFIARGGRRRRVFLLGLLFLPSHGHRVIICHFCLDQELLLVVLFVDCEVDFLETLGFF